MGIPKHEDRSPVWPTGVIGTISHFEQHAAAAVASAAAYRGLGLDLESPETLSAEIATMVCRPEESGDTADAKLLFSIKEAIYKCIYPVVGHYVDFQEMEVRLDTTNASYSAIPHSETLDTRLIAGLQGKYYRHDTMVLASAWLPEPTA